MSSILIGITTKNRAEILPKAIDSALSQSFRNKSVIVFNDASTDNTADVEKQYSEVKWINSKVSKGLVYARNLFLGECTTDYICSLDDDAWFIRKDAIEYAVTLMESLPDVGALAFDIRDNDQPDLSPITLEVVETNMFIGCGHILRVSATRQVGCYVPPPGYYGGEEKDLCIRLMDAGYKIIKVKGLFVWHDKTKMARNGLIQHRSGVCNDLVFAFRRTPGLLLIPSIVSKIVKHLGFSMRYKEEPLLSPCLRGIADFVKFLFAGRIARKSVSMKTFTKYLKLNAGEAKLS